MILPMNRRRFAAVVLAATAPFAGAGRCMAQPASPARAAAPSSASSATERRGPPKTMLTRPIPSTREPLPVIGCGTYIGFDVARDAAALARLDAVVEALRSAGGRVLDTSPMYGRAEAVLGELPSMLDDARSRGVLAGAAGAAGTPAAQALFVATKVWIEGRAAGLRQLEDSFRLMKRSVIDLVQVHNLVDWRTQLATLRGLRDQGRVRYVGVSHYTASAYPELESVLRAEKLDFVQLNYAVDDREAERRILPLAAERGVAVLVNRPFGGGGLLRRLRDKPLPGWAAEIGASSWAQLLLKFVLSNPAVTCAIPGTGDPVHMAENAAAGATAPPDAAFWKRHLAEFPG